VDSLNGQGKTPLIVAAEYGRMECVRVLLAAGANASAADQDGRTALHWAADGGNVSCVKLLLRAGACPAAVAADGRTPVHHATGSRHAGFIHSLLGAGMLASEVAECLDPLFVAGGGVDVTDFSLHCPVLLQAAIRGAEARLALLQPNALAGAEARLRALDVREPLEALRLSAAVAVHGDCEDALLVRELSEWADALVAALAAKKAAASAAEACFSTWRAPMEAEISAVRRGGGGRNRESEKSVAWAQFAVAAAKISKCTTAADKWGARASEAWAKLLRERERAEQTLATLKALVL
jgi:ankyrin repeat protein